MNEKRIKILSQDKIELALFKLSMPAIIGMLVNAIYNAVDTMFVGWIGTSQVAAATVVFPLFMLISSIGLCFGVGAASYISRLLGQDNYDEANKTASTSLFSSFFVGVIFTILISFNLEFVLKLFGATSPIMAYSVDYGSVIVLGSVLTMVNMTMNNTLRAEGSAKVPMITMSSGAILNIILDPIFIFTLGLGIKGAAIATVISQLLSTILLLSYYLSEKSLIKLKLKYISFSTKIYEEILKIGIPTMLRQVFSSISMALLNNIAIIYGSSILAGVGIVNRVYSIGFFIILGINQGFQPIAGFNYGSKNYKRLSESIKVAIKWSTIFSAIYGIILVIFSKQIASIFLKDSQAIIITSKGLVYYGIASPLAGFIVIISGIYQALGRGLEAAVLSTAKQGWALIPWVFILPHLLDYKGVFLCQPFADLTTALITIFFAIKIRNMIQSNILEKQTTA
ncbi:MAG: MATE family efflux transporter [Clostridiaceae bacterium]